MIKQQAPSCSNCGSRHHSLLANCTKPELDRLDHGKTCAFYKKGEHLFLEGAYPHGMYCLLEGILKVYKTGMEGKEQILYFVQPGSFVGYTALIMEDSYTDSAVVLQDASVCVLPREILNDLLRTNPMLNREMMKALCRELELEHSRLLNMAQKTVRERLAETLLMLLESFRNSRGRPELIDLALPREDLANLVGTATESVIRLLSEFKKDGLIGTYGKKIAVLDERKLQKLARLGTAYDYQRISA